MHNLRVSGQVELFLRSLPPGPKHALKKAIGRLANQQGDLTALEVGLTGYWRLRVSRYRVLFAYEKPMTIVCVHAGERSLIYEVFGAMLQEHLKQAPAPDKGEETNEN
jgi:mRNA interferase RelE/StbE